MDELHSALDFARDVLVAVIAGLLLPAAIGYFAHRRADRERIRRHALEIRHTQRETHVAPVFPEYPADRL